MNNIAIGSGATATGSRIISIGQDAGGGATDDFSIYNVNIGANAGTRTVGSDNVFMGRNTGGSAVDSSKSLSDTDATSLGMSGNNNVVLGTKAGQGAGRKTNANNFIGSAVVMNSATGTVGTSNNVLIGIDAGNGMSVTNGDNVFIGKQAGLNHSFIATSKIGNTYYKAEGTLANPYSPVVLGIHVGVGGNALDASSGKMNVAMGWKAGQQLKGSNNTAVGYRTLQFSTGDGNTALVPGAGSADNAAGGMLSSHSISVGSYAKRFGNESIAIGSDARAGERTTYSTAINSIAIGKGAQALAKNSISIGTGNVVTGEGSGAYW